MITSYPNVLRRYVAALIDAAVIWSCVYALSRTGIVVNSSWGMPLAVALVVLVYEPVFTSRLCTVGQLLMGFRVRTHTTLERLSLVKAYARVLVKYLLGIFSLLTIPVQPERRAIHDLAADSIVIEISAVPVPVRH